MRNLDWLDILSGPEDLEVSMFGPYTMEETLAIPHVVAEALVRSGHKKVLLTGDTYGTIFMNAMETLGQEQRELITEEHRFAVVYMMEANYDREAAAKEISESVGMNLRAFPDGDAAREWLLSEE